MIKRIIKGGLNRLGFVITKKASASQPQPGAENTMLLGLKRINSLGFIPGGIIDVGAAMGDWTKKAAGVWPKADYLLFEPLEERKAALEDLKAHSAYNVFLALAAAGKEEGEVVFHVAEDLDGSGMAKDNSPSASRRNVKLTSIDLQVRSNGLRSPYLIKLDTHGFELPILEGAAETLKDTLVVVIECYGFYIAPGSLLFWQMCRHMEEYGFRLFDIVDIMRRPGDNAFWQCDAFFIKKDNVLFDNNNYQ